MEKEILRPCETNIFLRAEDMEVILKVEAAHGGGNVNVKTLINFVDAIGFRWESYSNGEQWKPMGTVGSSYMEVRRAFLLTVKDLLYKSKSAYGEKDGQSKIYWFKYMVGDQSYDFVIDKNWVIRAPANTIIANDSDENNLHRSLVALYRYHSGNRNADEVPTGGDVRFVWSDIEFPAKGIHTLDGKTELLGMNLLRDGKDGSVRITSFNDPIVFNKRWMEAVHATLKYYNVLEPKYDCMKSLVVRAPFNDTHRFYHIKFFYSNFFYEVMPLTMSVELPNGEAYFI